MLPTHHYLILSTSIPAGSPTTIDARARDEGGMKEDCTQGRLVMEMREDPVRKDSDLPTKLGLQYHQIPTSLQASASGK